MKNLNFCELKSGNQQNFHEIKSFEVELSPQVFVNEEISSPTSHHNKEINENFFVQLCMKWKNKQDFIPFLNENSENYRKTPCLKAFILMIILGFIIMLYSFVYLCSLNENSYKFVCFVFSGSVLIIISLIFAKGINGIFIFFLKNNMFSILFSYSFNLFFLWFFVIKAKSYIFSTVFAFSQVFFFLFSFKFLQLDYAYVLFTEQLFGI